MLNVTHYTVLAGSPDWWDAEMDQRVAAGESLIVVQEDQHFRGRRSAELTKGPNGYGVRFASSLDGRDILLAEEHTRNHAINWGKAWAEADPEDREFFARNDRL